MYAEPLMLISLHSLIGSIPLLVHTYGYAAIFVLMLLESASFPVPSEVVLPLAGALAAQGSLNFAAALLVGIAGSIIGCLIDYAIGYFIGREIVYKHLGLFHIKRETLDGFDAWFERNRVAAVVFTRFIPIIRTVINFPAGFARMPLKQFVGYSLVGIVIWDAVLMAFGYLVLSTRNAELLMAAIGAFTVVLYIIYRFAGRSIKHTS